ncbi:MAG: TAXI family TRAP transporter solute-binding subunit [Fluviibacter sp.]
MDPINNKKMPPKAPGNFRAVVIEELLAFWSFLLSNWLYILPGLLLVLALLYIVRPMPPKSLTIATGQYHSTADVVGQRYREFFRQHGVDLQLVESKGAEDNLSLLAEGKVDAAFSQGGMALPEEARRFVSLGSVVYQPLWLFHYQAEGVDQDLNKFLQGKRVSINIPGSSTRAMVQQLLKAQGVNTDPANFLAMSTKDSVTAFKERKIDAIFLLGAMASKNVQEIAQYPGVQIYSFPLATAYAKRFQYLDPVVLPAGTFNLHPIVPKQDVHMIATTLDILTKETMHPALQLLFMEATDDFERKRVSFFAPGKFPTYMDTRIPESDVARRYFKEGSPFLWGYVPFWMASLFDEVWFYLIAVGAIVIPVIGFWPSYRKTHAVLSIESCYNELRMIETEISLVRQETGGVKADMLYRIDQLKDKVRELWVPTGNRSAYYDLRAAINIVREDIVAELATQDQVMR